MVHENNCHFSFFHKVKNSQFYINRVVQFRFFKGERIGKWVDKFKTHQRVTY